MLSRNWNKTIAFLILNTYFCIYVESCIECSSYEENFEVNVHKWELECLKESKARAWDVLRVKTGNLPLIPTYDGTIQNWSLCILVKAGIMSKQGVFRIDEAMKLVAAHDRERVMKKVDDCLQKIYKTLIPPPFAPEIGWRYIRCYNYKQPSKFKIL
ncbi:hypothetical protein O0L34_g2925 [Tuta absoluta]|nr:hypothetical protein O0L34_g2925 [Tuta absoluta]